MSVVVTEVTVMIMLYELEIISGEFSALCLAVFGPLWNNGIVDTRVSIFGQTSKCMGGA